MAKTVFSLPERAVIHFNVADFAVAVERVKDSSLKEQPLIIAPMGGARTIVYDMSEEAYGDGVRKGMALKQARRLCRKAQVFPPRTELYQRAMMAFVKELKNYSPLIEAGQADGHFFVDVTGTHRLFGPPPDVGWRVRREVRSRLGINPIWALGNSRLISKVASRLVKPVGEYIVNLGEEANFLAPLSVDLLPGLREDELVKLYEFQLTTIGAIARLSHNQLMVPFGPRATFLHEASNGVDNSRLCVDSAKEQLVELEHSFKDDTNDRLEVETVVATLAAKAGTLLRKRKKVARRLGIWLRYSDGGHVVRQASHRSGTSGEFLMQKLAATALERAWLRRTRIRSCRLVCDRLQRQSPQLSLFDGQDAQKHKEQKIITALDSLRNRYGNSVIGVGSQYRSPVTH